MIALRSLYNEAQHLDYCWMIRFIHLRDALIHTIDSKCKLDEIIRTDAEKVNFLRKHISNHHCRWYLNHTAHRDLLIEHNAFRTQLLLRFLKRSLCRSNLINRCNKWKHDFNLAMNTRA